MAKFFAGSAPYNILFGALVGFIAGACWGAWACLAAAALAGVIKVGWDHRRPNRAAHPDTAAQVALGALPGLLALALCHLVQ